MFSGLQETTWKPFEALGFFVENDSLGLGGSAGRWEDRELPRLPFALNHVESKWACTIPARGLAH
jgi:hypothetical protein